MHVKIFPNIFTDGVDEVPPEKLSQFSSSVAKCIDGVDGCAVSPLNPINISDAGASSVAELNIISCVCTGAFELYSAAGHANIQWRFSNIDNQDTNIFTPGNYEFFVINLTAEVVIVLGAIGDNALPSGTRIKIRSGASVGGDYIIGIFQEEAGGTLGTQLGEIDPNTALHAWMEFIFDGTNWYASSWSGYGNATASVIK